MKHCTSLHALETILGLTSFLMISNPWLMCTTLHRGGLIELHPDAQEAIPLNVPPPVVLNSGFVNADHAGSALLAAHI